LRTKSSSYPGLWLRFKMLSPAFWKSLNKWNLSLLILHFLSLFIIIYKVWRTTLTKTFCTSSRSATSLSSTTSWCSTCRS
jgi:hypothetical protein